MVDLKDFNYLVISLRNPGSDQLQIINTAYLFWRSFWIKELFTSPESAPHWGNEFYRHDYLTLIMHKNLPVALHLYGFQNLELTACVDQSYFDDFDREVVPEIIQSGYKKVITAGWLSVNPEYLKFNREIVFSRCLSALGLRFGKYNGFQAAIAPARSDNGVSQKFMEWGGVTYGLRNVYGIPCELIVMDVDNNIPLTYAESELVAHLWNCYLPVVRQTVKIAA